MVVDVVLLESQSVLSINTFAWVDFYGGLLTFVTLDPSAKRNSHFAFKQRATFWDTDLGFIINIIIIVIDRVHHQYDFNFTLKTDDDCYLNIPKIFQVIAILDFNCLHAESVCK